MALGRINNIPTQTLDEWVQATLSKAAGRYLSFHKKVMASGDCTDGQLMAMSLLLDEVPTSELPIVRFIAEHQK